MNVITKIKDGVFLGDIESSQDAEFIELNKITRIINCAAGQVRGPTLGGGESASAAGEGS